jgi:hypothetical protein
MAKSAFSGSFREGFQEAKELGPVGFGPPGAPSKNPATADKAEKKKRGARTATHGKMPAGNLFVDLCANGLHANCITADDFRSKGGVLKNTGRSVDLRSNRKAATLAL